MVPVPKVSVIIPSYNHEAYIGEAIQSVLLQDFQNYELLIADDSSSDHSVDVINTFTDARIKTFFLKENLGATEILKFLIERTQGEYIALLNSDDRWHQGKLSKQVAFLDQNPEYAACFTWADFINEHGELLDGNGPVDLEMFMRKNRTQCEWLNYFFYNGNCLCHPSVLIRRSVYETLGFYNGAFRQLPDFAYWVRLCTKYPFHILEEILVDHRRTTGENNNTSAVTGENTRRLMSEAVNIFTWLFENIDDDMFTRAFQNTLVRGNASGRAEITCEKYFLLARNPLFGVALKNQACQFFMNHYLDDGVARCFKEKYHYTQNDFFKDNTLSGISPEKMGEENITLNATVYYAEKKFTPENALIVFPTLEGQHMKLRFTLRENAKKIRVDPVEGYGIFIRRATAYVNGNLKRIVPLNSFHKGSRDCFFSKDPQYIMHGSFKKGDSVDVEFVVDNIINYHAYRVQGSRIVNDDDFEQLLCVIQGPFIVSLFRNIKKWVRKKAGF